jgi:hypothetical protein
MENQQYARYYTRLDGTPKGESMKPKNTVENRIRGWLPKEANLAYAHKSPKPRWRKPVWITLALVGAVAFSAIVFVGAQTYIRYSSPQADVTAAFYEKNVNCTSANIGDVVEVNVMVYWHGYVIPEFKRDVKIVDPVDEGNFAMMGEGNVYESTGHGGSYQLKYLLRVVGGEGASVSLPKPRLFLDNVEIPLSGSSPTLNIS